MFTKVNKKHPLVQGRCGCAGIAVDYTCIVTFYYLKEYTDDACNRSQGLFLL